MKLKVILVTALAALTIASPATAAPSASSLQKQVNTLKAQVKQLTGLIMLVNDKDTCTTALSFDVHRLTAMYVGIGDIGRLDDEGACARVGVTRDGTLHAMRSLSSARLALDQVVEVRNDLAQALHHHDQ